MCVREGKGERAYETYEGGKGEGVTIEVARGVYMAIATRSGKPDEPVHGVLQRLGLILFRLCFYDNISLPCRFRIYREGGGVGGWGENVAGGRMRRDAIKIRGACEK